MFRLAALIFISFSSAKSFAYLTSDVDAALGYTNLNFTTNGNTVSLTSLSTLNFSYNLNNAAWNTALNIIMSEVVASSQGPLAWTRLALGARYYPTGFNAQRVIFENRVSGYYWRPAPFVGISSGLSNFSIKSIDGGSGYLNASALDVSLRAGAEVVLTTNLFLTGELDLVSGMPAQSSKTGYDFSYTGIEIFIGLKVISF